MATKALAGLLIEHREEILHICAKHGAGNVRVFGSMARGDFTEASDVDFLVDVVGPTTQGWPGGSPRRVDETLITAISEHDPHKHPNKSDPDVPSK